MKTAIRKVYKAEIQQHLLLAKGQIENLLSDVESNVDWLIFHQHTKTVVSHLGKAIALLAEQHITECVLSKYRDSSTQFQSSDVNEVMKAYRYLG